MRKGATVFGGAGADPRRRLPDPAADQCGDFPTHVGMVADLDDASPLPMRSPIKRIVDVAVAACGLAIMLPTLCAVAVAIKATSSGPILFRQRRYGLNNRLFVMYKFRTMYIEKEDATGVRQTRVDDDRVTPVGKVLRRTNLDELPQLLNIVRGDMSLVGPRPHVPGMLAAGIPYEDLVPNYFQRHRVRPGLTGLAQARGFRGSTESAVLARGRVNLDIEYIERWSVGLDLRLILETIWLELRKAGNGI